MEERSHQPGITSKEIFSTGISIVSALNKLLTHEMENVEPTVVSSSELYASQRVFQFYRCRLICPYMPIVRTRGLHAIYIYMH